MGSGMNYVCGEMLSKTTVPVQKCSGFDGDGSDPPCRALTLGTGWRQKQVCQKPKKTGGVCPGLTTCCDSSRCSTNMNSLPTCDQDGACSDFTASGQEACATALKSSCQWSKPKYGACNKLLIKGSNYNCKKHASKTLCKSKSKARNHCKWHKKKCSYKCDAFAGKEKGCLKAKKFKKKLCAYNPTGVIPGTGCTTKQTGDMVFSM